MSTLGPGGAKKQVGEKGWHIKWMNQSMTAMFVKQPLASPRSCVCKYINLNSHTSPGAIVTLYFLSFCQYPWWNFCCTLEQSRKIFWISTLKAFYQWILNKAHANGRKRFTLSSSSFPPKFLNDDHIFKRTSIFVIAFSVANYCFFSLLKKKIYIFFFF